MTGFMNSDGSSLIGGLNPSSIGQALQVDVSGNLLIQDFIRQATIAGKAFIATNGCPSQNANTYGFSVFNPANSGKSILIYSARQASGASGTFIQLSAITADPAFDQAATPINCKLGGAASAIATHVTWSDNNQSITGTAIIAEPGPQNNAVDLLSDSRILLLPAGSAHGVIAFMTTFGNGYFAQSIRWIEF